MRITAMTDKAGRADCCGAGGWRAQRAQIAIPRGEHWLWAVRGRALANPQSVVPIDYPFLVPSASFARDPKHPILDASVALISRSSGEARASTINSKSSPSLHTFHLKVISIGSRLHITNHGVPMRRRRLAP
ncbi:hypothetical protein K1T71_006058 [Dendrolimus kikuchii]|uniref:Uncharacterized protein n=1 Tax=Dendrolimus kikuchii TaxID=765133 RepID=A0ACC1D397_9NEOP|nr:hypothetical protein K1T71_006058 [Dendrolimus kikuchii]